LYTDILDIRPSQPDWYGRDRFILSKGHCCSAVYAALALSGFFPVSQLDSYGEDGSTLMAHISHKVPGVEFSTGSLGHGLPFGCGKAIAAKRLNQQWRTFVLLSDGELDEGSNWEAILFAPQHLLSNLTVIIDYNKIQSLGRVKDILDLEPLRPKFESFRWAVKEVDGHSHDELRSALSGVPWEPNRPSCLKAHTTKGKGVDFMESQLAWHYKSPNSSEEIEACRQIGQSQ
jgi:transketolase